ncbi:MAG: hypothetical protein J0M24_13760 [Verrucomicrobia bacterium]|nr:hypothetical protein [Verrucomicrobiota bacterium]
MAGELTGTVRLALNKVGFTPTSGDITFTLDSSDGDGLSQTQDLTADTSEALVLGDVELPCGKILLKLITPTSGTNVEVSLKNSPDFDTYRFAVLTKQNDVALWTPKLGTTIYVKAIGAGARIAVLAG